MAPAFAPAALNSIRYGSRCSKEFDEIKAILKAVAKSQAAADARMDRADARMDRSSDERFDKRMRGFEKLVRIGMTELRRFEKETDRKIDALVDAQQRTGSQSQSLPRLPSVQRRELRHPARAESLTPNTWHLALCLL